MPDSPTSLGSSFASLSLSPSSGVGFPSPTVSEDETIAEHDEDDSSDDEFIVLRRSESGTGSGGPLRAGLAASASSLAGSTPLAVEDEPTGAETPRVADASEVGQQLVTERWDQSEDDEQESSRPTRWADEGEDELGTSGRPSTASHLGPKSPAAAAVAADDVSRPPPSTSRGTGPRRRRRPAPRRRPKARDDASSAGTSASSSSRRSSRTDSMPPSVLCTDDSASAVLDLFFDDGNAFGGAGPGNGGQLGKLRFWQSLIVELGILPAPDSAWSDLSSFGSSSSSLSSSSSSSAASDRTATTTTSAFPTTLTAASRLLRAEAHVNLVDYLALRARAAAASDDDERAELRARMKGLRKSSRTALRWYTRRSHKFAKKTLVKRQWLSPLMIDVL